MEGIKLNVKALAGYMRMSIAELAEGAGVDVYHLQAVSADRAKMTADDLVKLAQFTGINPFNIETGKQG